MHDIGNRMGFKVNQIGPVHPTVEGGYQAALALEGGDTTAIIIYNDLIAVGIVLRFTADGVNVPGDVSVIGFDNTLIAPVVTPPITSIRIPRAQLGQVAVRRLLLMMISPMILLGVFLWIPGMPFGIYVFACWRCTWEMTPETAGFGAHARGEKRDGHVGMAGWLRRARLVLREYASTLRVKEFRKHLAIYLLVQVTMDVFGQTFVSFVVHDWNHTAAFASLLLGCAAVSLPLMPVFGWAMTKIGPKRLYAIIFIGWLGAAWLFAAWMLVGTLPEPWWTVFAVIGSLWFFAFKSLCGYLPWAVFPYIADIDQIVTRRYRSATFSGIQASFRQLGSGIATIAVGLGAGRGRLRRDARTADDGGGHWIGSRAAGLVYRLAVAMVICWIVSAHLAINKRTDGIVLTEITRLRNGGDKADVTPETRHVVERLTGLPYENCWR